MTTRISSWGNSIGVRLPRHVAQAAGVKAGTPCFVLVDAATGDIIIRPARQQSAPVTHKSAGSETKPKRVPDEW